MVDGLLGSCYGVGVVGYLRWVDVVFERLFAGRWTRYTRVVFCA